MADWVEDQIQKTIPDLINILSLQTGMDFTQFHEVTRVLAGNRYGEADIVELELIADDNSTMTVGVIVKHVYEGENYFKYIIDTSEKFIELMEARQGAWLKKKTELAENFKKILHFAPDSIFAPKIFARNEDTHIIQFEILPRFVARPKSGIGPQEQNLLLGYALARMHGFSNPAPVQVSNYTPWFEYFAKLGVSKKVLEEWEHSLTTSKGGVPYSFGDYSVESILYNSLTPGRGRLDSLCMIDPILIPNGDRSEDLGYLLSNIAEKYIDTALQKTGAEVSSKKILTEAFDMLMFKTGPDILNAYMTLCPEFPALYDNDEVPIDFFVAGFLLQKAQLYIAQNYKKMSNILSVMGNQFIEAKPFTESIKLRFKK